MTDITVPILGESISEATVGRWRKSPGEQVARDEILVELETDKVAIEVAATDAGTLDEIVSAEGETVEIGAVLARIGDGAPAADEPAAPNDAQKNDTAKIDTAKIDITIPAMGESVSEGTLARWMVAVGETVAQDTPLAEIETDKVAVEIPSPAAGSILALLVEEGAQVLINQVIAHLGPGKTSPAQTVTPAATATATATTSATGEKAIAPSVRRIAGDAGIDPASIEGSGRGGRASKADALAHVAKLPKTGTAAAANGASNTPPLASSPLAGTPGESAERPTERVKMTRLRQTIARRLKEAQNTAATLTTFNDVDLSEIMSLRKRYKDNFEQHHGVKLGFMGFFGRACVDALKEIPAVNGQIDGDHIVYHHYYDISIAVGTDRGLVTPVVRNADRLSLAGIETEITRLGKLARDGKITIDDLRGGTFTITNGGVYGSMLSTPIINPPQSAVLGMHRIEQRPVAVGSDIRIRPMMYLALSYDHRIIDGKEAVTFLVRIKEALEHPERMLLGL